MTTTAALTLPPDVERTVAQLLQLPPEQRLAIRRRLEASFSRAEINQAWNDEIAKRIREIETGAVKGIPAEMVFREAEERLGEKL